MSDRARRPRAVLALQVLSFLLAGTLLAFLPELVSRWGRTILPKVPADLRVLAAAIRGYALEHGGRAPATLEALVEPTPSGERWLDMDSIPRDSWGRPYVYEALEGSPVRLRCLGEDGLAGGDGDDEDLEVQVELRAR